MKLLTTFLFIFLASSTYRCANDDTINCSQAAQEMVGEWTGESHYVRPSSADGNKHEFTLTVESSKDCSFTGFTTFKDSNNTFKVIGIIDIYGWVEFIEDSFISNGEEYSNCLIRTNSNAVCSEWPDLRWKEGTKYEETRFRRDPYILTGEFHRPSSFERWWQILRGTYTLTKK